MKGDVKRRPSFALWPVMTVTFLSNWPCASSWPGSAGTKSPSTLAMIADEGNWRASAKVDTFNRARKSLKMPSSAEGESPSHKNDKNTDSPNTVTLFGLPNLGSGKNRRC
ncbi:hypothetical protein KCV07_g30, partial [Aureobasidium melanogenum]